MPQCPIAHFACHGTSDPEDPSNSRLLLHDHEMAPFTVASLASIRLDHARLAYLSACETAFATKLLDEGIHLASAFQLAGYPNVVATLWNVNDLAAARIADDFYGNLAADSANAASALHQAVRTLRNELPGTPSLWAAHIHVGA
jgi:CHAT domain-containing protein